MACKIKYLKNGTAKVSDYNGNPSQLYEQLLNFTGNQEEAIDMITIAYTDEFIKTSPTPVNQEPSLENVLRYMDVRESLDSTVNPEDKLDITNVMMSQGYEYVEELENELNRVFKPNGYLELDYDRIITSPLYSEYEARQLINDDNLIKSLKGMMSKVSGMVMRGESINVTQIDVNNDLKNTSEISKFGTYNKVNNSEIEQAILNTTKGMKSRKLFDLAIQDIPYTSVLERYNNDAEYANEIYNRFSKAVRVNNAIISNGELVPKKVNSQEELLNSTLLVNQDNSELEKEINDFLSISLEVMNNNSNETKEVLKGIEELAADLSIDIIGLSEKPFEKVVEFLPSLLDLTNKAFVRTATPQDIKAYSEKHQEVFNENSENEITYEFLQDGYEKLGNIVRLETELDADTVFERFGLIKVAENIYHRVDNNASVDTLYEFLFRDSLNENPILSKDDVDLQGIENPNNKPKILENIKSYINARSTGLTYNNQNNKEKVSLYQVIFGHKPLTSSLTPTNVNTLSKIQTKPLTLQTSFVSKFYKYVLNEKLKNSNLFKDVLSNFKFTNRDITLKSKDNTFLAKFEANKSGIKYLSELLDYSAIKKSDPINILREEKGIEIEPTTRSEIFNNPNLLENYNGSIIQSGNLYVIKSSDNFIKQGNKIYESVGENVFMDITPQPNESYNDLTLRIDYSESEVAKLEKENAEIPEKEKITKIDEFREKYDNRINFQTIIGNENRLEKENKEILQGVYNQLKKSKLADNTYFMSNNEIENKLKELGYSDEIIKQVTAWHGTPHSFDRFTTEKMGTGEGAQAFGWGLYFTDLEDIAVNYADRLGETTKILYKGEDINTISEFSDIYDYLIPDNDGLLEFNEVSQVRDMLNTVQRMAESTLKTEYNENNIEEIEYREETTNILRYVKEIKENFTELKVIHPTKNIYKVTLHKGKQPSEYTWLEYDRQVGDEVFDKIENQAILEGNVMLEMLSKSFNRTDKDGNSVYRNISNILNSDKEASLFLLRAGIDGIKYPAESISRGATSDTARGFNYVVFDENAITIEEQIQFQKDGDLNVTTNGFTINENGQDNIYINLESRNPTETLLHENSHIYLNKLKKANSEMYQSGLDLVNNYSKFDLPKFRIFDYMVPVSELDKIKEFDRATPLRGDEYYQILKEDIRRNGIGEPITIISQGGKMIINEGNHRLRAAKELGIKEIPVKMSNYKMSEEQLKRASDSIPLQMYGFTDTQLMNKENVIFNKIDETLIGIIDFVKQNQPNLQEGTEKFANEVLAEITGRRAFELLESKEESDVKTWLQNFFEWLKGKLGLTQYSNEQVANMNISEYADAIGIDILKGEDFLGEQGKINFEKWKGENRIVEGYEIQDVKTGTPIVAKVYHGTTNKFYEFDSSVKGDIEGHLGKVNYFTSDYQDASINYLADGTDLTNRIEKEEDIVRDTIFDNEWTTFDGDLKYKEIADNFGIDFKTIDNLDIDEVVNIIASKDLKGDEEIVLELYVKLNNPVVLGSGSTWFETLNISEEDFNEAITEIADENDITEEEAKEDYYFEIEQRAIENSGYENLHVEALQKALDDNGYSRDASEVLGDFSYETEVDLEQIEDWLRKDADLYDNNDGEIATSQVISDFFKNLGYDGIILTNVSERFKSMNLGSSTSHIHVFDDFNNQIKLSSGENVTFNENTSDIRFQKQVINEDIILNKIKDINISLNNPINSLSLLNENELSEKINECR